MNREIRFRGVMIDSDEWLYGYYHYLPYTGSHCIDVPMDGCNNSILYYVKPETVGQFTGLLDLNGKEIYEGDILSCWGGEQCQGYWEFSCLSPLNDIREINEFCDNYDYIEVLGNIWENPELLEVQHEQS